MFTASPNHCQGARLTWIRVFTSSGFEQQVGWRFACSVTIFFSKLTSAFAWTRLQGTGVLLVALDCFLFSLLDSYLLRSVSLEQRLVHTWKVRLINCSQKGYWNTTDQRWRSLGFSMGQMVVASSTARHPGPRVNLSEKRLPKSSGCQPPLLRCVPTHISQRPTLAHYEERRSIFNDIVANYK